MTIDGNTPVPAPGDRPGLQRQPTTPEDAARQFEEILVRQLVGAMTEGLFKSSPMAEGGPGWIDSHRDMQRDVLEEVLAKHLVESGSLRLSDLLLRQWRTAHPGLQKPTPSPDTLPAPHVDGEES